MPARFGIMTLRQLVPLWRQARQSGWILGCQREMRDERRYPLNLPLQYETENVHADSHKRAVETIAARHAKTG
jgi:hypothetical protein